MKNLTWNDMSEAVELTSRDVDFVSGGVPYNPGGKSSDKASDAKTARDNANRCLSMGRTFGLTGIIFHCK